MADGGGRPVLPATFAPLVGGSRRSQPPPTAGSKIDGGVTAVPLQHCYREGVLPRCPPRDASLFLVVLPSRPGGRRSCRGAARGKQSRRSRGRGRRGYGEGAGANTVAGAEAEAAEVAGGAARGKES